MTIDSKLFECIKRDLADGVVASIMETRGLSENDAIRIFMKSRVYDCLQDQETEVWHFSVRVLSRLFEDEMRGNLVWPVAP